MARASRNLIVFPGYQLHKIWRGHNKEFNLQRASWKLQYLKYMNEEVQKSKTTVHALTLMDNHTHEVCYQEDQKDFSEFMRRHHMRYGLYFNRANNRSGKVAEDRPKTCLLEHDQASQRAILYVHANPHRSTMNRSLALNYRFSTHRLYAYGKREPWMQSIRFPEWYVRLGKTPASRQRAYRKLFARFLRESGIELNSSLKKHFFGSFSWTQSNKNTVRSHLREQREPKPPD